MNDWINVFDGVFFITISTIVFGFFGLSIKYCLKSKCENISLCFGLFTVHRRVDLEVQEEMREIDAGITNTEEEKI